MSNVIQFKRPEQRTEFLLLYAATLFHDSGGFPAPFWIEAWDGYQDSETTVVWRGANYRALRRAALEMMRDDDLLINLVAHSDLLGHADAALLATQSAAVFALEDYRVMP